MLLSKRNSRIQISAHLKDLKPSGTLEINEETKRLIQSGKKVYKFGFGQSPFPIPYEVEDALKSNSHQKAYLPVRGLDQLRINIANHTNHLIPGANYTKDNVFVGPGSKELIYLIQLATSAPLILPSPSWVSYEPQAVISQKKVHWISTEPGRLRLTASRLENYLSINKMNEGLLILNYPCNPTGHQFEKAELKEIAQVCRNREITILSDEIYGLLSFDKKYYSISEYYPEGTIISTGLSKWCAAGGWRLGAFIIPDELQYLNNTLATLASETFSAVSAPIQYAAVTAYADLENVVSYRIMATEILSIVGDYCYQKLKENGVNLSQPKGGFYLFPNFDHLKEEFNAKGIFTSHDLCKALLKETGVVLLSSIPFGWPSNELSVRLSFVDFDGSAALDHYSSNRKIDPADFEVLFPDIVEGMKALTQWISFTLK